jgi:predicted nucleic acid-binding protein
MILTPDNEYAVVLDACVLIPMPLCDTLLRSAEEPSFFRIAWSREILDEVERSLARPPFCYSSVQINRRISAMESAFPEALYDIPPNLIESVTCTSDPNDRHVVALAIHSHANTIVTNNVRHFRTEGLLPHGLTILSADEFLVHQYHLNPAIMLEKLDRQAAGIRKQRTDILQLLCPSAPEFYRICVNRDILA